MSATLSVPSRSLRRAASSSARPHAPGVARITLPIRPQPMRLPVCKALDRDPFFGDSFFTREMALMDRQMAQMDSEINSMLQMTRRMELDAQRQADEAVLRAQQGIMEPNVQIRRSEERSLNSYRYQQSITITSGPSYVYTYAASPPAVGFSPWLFMAAMIAGAYAALAAAFARNAHLTTYKNDSAWRLGLMWPVLMITSTSFRQQFWSAVRGKRARANASTDSED